MIQIKITQEIKKKKLMNLNQIYMIKQKLYYEDLILIFNDNQTYFIFFILYYKLVRNIFIYI